MKPSLEARFLDAFLRGFRQKMGEIFFHGLILALTVYYWFSSGRFEAHFWESAAPWLWFLDLIAAYHIVKAAFLLNREISSSGSQRTSTILSERGKPFDLPQPEIPHYRFKVFGMASFGVLICALFAVLVAILAGHSFGMRAPAVSTGTVDSPPPLQATELYMECHQMYLPIRIPSGKTIHVKTLNKKQYENTRLTMFDIRNDGPKEWLWPDLKLINSVKSNAGVVGYECDVENHAQINLVDVAIGLSTNFDSEKQPLIYTAIVSPLDAGATFRFYLVNECPVMASVIAPDAVAVQIIGEDKRRTIPLHWPHRSPIEKIMVFFPSKVSWTTNACE
jgi:hypothetical protein